MENLTNVVETTGEVVEVAKEAKKSLKPALEKVAIFAGGTVVGVAVKTGIDIVKAGIKAKKAETETEVVTEVNDENKTVE